ncbi:MAG: hypothetical protein ACF8R9_16490 [Phycisphaerales bacterium JB054]
MSDRVLPFSTAAQAYGNVRPLMVRAVPQGQSQSQAGAASLAERASRADAHDSFDLSAAAKARSTPTNPLAAAKVPGQVSFDGHAPAQAASAMPIYTNPAARNGAATGVNAGRLIDFEA